MAVAAQAMGPPRLRRVGRGLLQLLGALGVNVALFALAAYMVNSVAPDQVVEESPSMSLVSLSSQPPPDQEASRDEAQAPPEAEQPEAPRESANEAVAQEMAPAFPSQAQASAASDVGPPDFMGDLSAGGGIGGIAVRVGTGGGGGGGGRAGAQESIFDSVDLDQAPTPAMQVAPEYPLKAREQGIEGYVAVKFMVRPDGSVGNVNILGAKPEGTFEEAVRRVLPRWRFQPGRLHGEPVASWVVTTLRFDLN
jgi:protein TonB